jgi:Protein of unknown function (DUF4238)
LFPDIPKMTLKTRNHYVPELYQKSWAGADSKVWVYRILVPHPKVPLWKPLSTSGIGYHRNLYTRILAGEETDEFETWLEREIETPAAEPLRRAIGNARLTPDDWEHILRFVAAQSVRTPAGLVKFLKRQDAQLPPLIESVLQNVAGKLAEAQRTGRKIERPPNGIAAGFPLRVTTDIEPGEPMGVLKAETLVGRKLWLWSLRRWLTQTYKILQAHQWTILRPPSGINWFTSDHPVVRLNRYQDGRYDFSGGWGTPDTEILFPLSPQHLLYTRIGHRAPWLKGARAPELLARQLQVITIEHAHRYLYAAAEDPLVPEIRPRRVDPAAWRAEKDQWQQWGQDQSQAERDFEHPAAMRSTQSTEQ